MAERHVLQVYVGSLSRLYEALSIEASKITTADEIVECICEKLGLHDGAGFYELAEVMGNEGGQDCKERRIGHQDCPVALQLLWPKKNNKVGGHPDFKFCLRRKLMGNLWSLSMSDSNDSQLIRDYFLRFLYQPRNCEYSDLCQLPDLTEQTLLENLKARFEKGHIYTYVGSILIAVNPFTFYPIYNPKYVQLYQNRRLGELQPHIFAIADAAYQSMLRKRTNQCIVISGESGSGKTESTNLLLHHLTALSQKGTHGSGVEQTILGAGPVLEAFGNAKTKFNNNSSRFGKFIQVNYKENGAVHGALVQKYLLEKSRIVSQVKSERNYHVFYYLLDGLSSDDKEKLYLTKPSDYFYLNQSKCYTLEGVDERHEFSRLTQSMEMVGFSRQKQFLCFKVLSAVLHLGNVQFSKKSTYHSDETVMIKNPEVITIISKLLQVKEETLTTALTCKRTKAAKGEMLTINYKLPDAIATRDAMAKCLYGALFDWIVMQVNHALLSKKDPREHKGNSIGVLDIFGFEDFADHNNFEQFCINYANERLQYYFNQHVFKYEQEEYQREGISWRNIDFNDNTECLKLIEDKPSGLLYLLDDQCNFPCGSNETVLQKFIYHHNSNSLFEVPPCRGSAFIIKHYAGKVKYQIRDFREKNLDLMRPDIVSVLKVSQMAFVRELVCSDPLALFRWQILKAFFKAYFLFSKLRELSKIKRGLTDAYLIKEFSASNRRRPSLTNTANNLSRTLSSDNHKDLHPTLSSASNDSIAEQGAHSYNNGSASSSRSNLPVLIVPNNASPSYRITRALLSRQALFANPGPMTHSPQCVHGALMRTASTNFSCPVHGSQAHLCSSEARVLSRANKILMKKKYSSSYHLSRKHSFDKSIRNFKLLKQLLGPPGTSNSSVTTSAVSVNKQHGIAIPRATRKQTPTVTHQFQQSLHQLMDTLSHANPFFVRCIKSNADKMPNHFDDRLVLQQLRYTGMLETVRIRQSGYSVRLTFDEFIQHYRILLPKGLLSSKMDVKEFLLTMKLQPNMYQIGKTKVFMRESEKLVLDERLHEEILRRIINLQRWVRTWLCRKRFAEMRNAAIVIQTYARRYIAQRRLSQLKLIAQYENWAANCIQKHWRCYQMRKWFTNLRRSVVNFQSSCRGHLLRSRMGEIIEEHSKARDEAKAQANKKNSVSVSIRTMPPVSQPKNSQSTSSLSRPVTVNTTTCPSSAQHSDYFSTVNISSIPSITTTTSTTNNNESCRSMSETNETSLITTSIDQMHVSQHEQRETSFPSNYFNYSSDNSGDLMREIDMMIRKDGNNNANAALANLISRDDSQVQQECDFDDDFENDDLVRLNRKRNIPIRKTSFKRKANKSLSDDKLLTSNDELPSGLTFNNSSTNLSENQHRQLTKLSSDSNVLLASTSSLSAFSSSGYNTNSDSASSFYKLRFDQMHNAEASNNPAQVEMQQQQLLHYRSQQIPSSPTTPTTGPASNQFVQHNRLQNKYSNTDESQSIGPIQKAKTTIKNIMGKSSNQEINKRMLKQSISVKSGAEFDSQNENIYNYSNNKSLPNIDIGVDVANYNIYNYNSSSQHNNQSQYTTQSISYNSNKPRLSQEGNFTLLSSHSIKKEEHFKSGEICAICENTMLISSINQSQAHYKCTDCKQLFHNKCIHLSTDIPCIKESLSGSSNNSSSVLSALNPSRPPRNKQKKVKNYNQKSYFSKENQESSATLISHNLLSTSDLVNDDSQGVLPATKQSVRITQFTDPNDILITDLDELQTMDKFISKKIREMEDVKKKTKESMVDVVYKIALKEFKANLISTYSVGNQDGYFRLTYKDLIDHFEQILINVCQKEKTYTSFPVIMGVNAFRGYMDELRKLHNRNDLKVREEKEKDKDKVNGYNSKKSYKRKQSKKARNRNKKEDEIFTSYEHEFILSTANIYTVCEVCSSYMWLMEKIWVCRRCKLTCHKKCVDKVAVTCRDNSKSSNKDVFGAALTSLTHEECRIPHVVEQLITKIELKGLYTEGIYRKSGTSSKINELKQILDAQIPDIDLDQYSIHVLAATLKLFFREMPEPLMTYELYDDFLWATTISDATERVQVILNHIGKLPKENYDLLERLTFHLARVAQQESANRMNANSLAIVFAPCVLRTNKMMQMQDKLHDISKQTICIESIISERMRQISDTLNDIDILDTACHTTSSRLSSIRHSKLNLNRDYVGLIRTTSNVDEEEALLVQHLDDLITEKNHLTTILPVFRLASACSDEDMLSSNENEEGVNQNSAGSDECLSPATVPTTLGPSYQPTNMKTNVTFINNLNNSLTSELTNAAKKYNSNLQFTTESKPRVTLQQKLEVHSPMYSTTGISANCDSSLAADREETLCHLTKNRVHTPHKRKPSRFDYPQNDDIKDNIVTMVDSRNRINSDMSSPAGINPNNDNNQQSNEAKQKFSSHENENPVMV